MKAKELTERLIQDLEKATLIENYSTGLGSVIQEAKSLPKDMGRFTAKAWLESSMPSLKGSVRGLIQMLSTNKNFKELPKSATFDEILIYVTDQSAEVEKVVDHLASGKMVDLGSGESSTNLIQEALDDFHNEVMTSFRAYEKLNP